MMTGCMSKSMHGESCTTAAAATASDVSYDRDGAFCVGILTIPSTSGRS